MADDKMGNESKKPCCNKDNDAKLVKANELPIYGNPHPPKDHINDDKPSLLLVKIRDARHIFKPYFEPIISGVSRTSDFLSVGVAHSKNTFDRITQSQDTMLKSFFIAAGGLAGLAIARKRGFFKKTLFGVSGFTVAAASCYPERAQEYANVAWFIATKKVPTMLESTYSMIDKQSGKKEVATRKVESEK